MEDVDDDDSEKLDVDDGAETAVELVEDIADVCGATDIDVVTVIMAPVWLSMTVMGIPPLTVVTLRID